MRQEIPIVGQRSEFLQKLPMNGVVAEIGVQSGIHALQMKNTSKPKRLYLIDTWAGDHVKFLKETEITMGINILPDTEFDFNKQTEEVVGIQGWSTITAKKFPDEYFDYVYIDASHSYTGVRDDINTWWPKVKMGGFLTGHDYIDGYEDDPVEYGIIKAVNEHIVKHDLTLNFLGKWTDWAVQKL
jgi:hypothetical protein